MKFKQDKFRVKHGGVTKLLNVSCRRKGHHLFYYQKDGQGMVKRFYLDRIYPAVPKSKQLTCKKCKELLGILENYKKDHRLAFKIFVGCVVYKRVAARSVN
jgi:hypothetical protein